jgi:beta-mannanase
LNRVRNHGSTPLITWEPYDTRLPADQKGFPLKAIAAGSFDPYIRSWAVGARNYGHPFFLRFAHEMQLRWCPWGYAVNGNQPEDYIAAYRHVHDVFAQEHVSNVLWVWSPDSDPWFDNPPLARFYPGDAYVDWLGVSIYNPGAPATWRSLSEIFGDAYTKLAALSGGGRRPIMVAEWSSVEPGGSKAQWITQAAADLATRFTLVKAVVWFDQPDVDPKGQFPLDSSPSALAAARAAFGSSVYALKLPY